MPALAFVSQRTKEIEEALFLPFGEHLRENDALHLSQFN
jgi:hypothetical protein